MAKTSDIEIVWEDETDPRNYIRLIVATSETLAPGDLVEIVTYNTNTCGPVDGAQSELFAGVSTGYYTAAQTATVCTDCVVKATNTSSAIGTGGIAVKYVSGDNGTAWVLGKCDNSEDVIGWSLEPIAASATGLFWITSKVPTVSISGTAFASSGAPATGLFRMGDIH